MKKILLATVASALSSTAMAGSINIDMRADYNSATYTDSTSSDVTKFYFKTGRLDYQNNVNDTLSYRLRLAFNKDATTGVDSTQTAAEYAYVTNKFTDYFSLAIGKMNTDVGGFEGATSGADLYMLSQHYTLKGPNGNLSSRAAGTGKNVGTSDLLYMTGAKGTFTFSDQTINLLVTNETNIAAANGPATNQNSSLMAVVWRGSFMEKTLMTNLSYHTMAGAYSKDRHGLIAAGILLNLNPFTFQADYLMNEFKEDSSGNKDTVNSIVAKFSYTGWEQWTPRLEIQASEEKLEVAGSGTNKFMGYGAILEYKPYADTNFRYHLAYNTVREEFDAALAAKDAVSQEVILGARLMTDILK